MQGLSSIVLQISIDSGYPLQSFAGKGFDGLPSYWQKDLRCYPPSLRR